MWARAYRDGELVCDRVEVVTGHDDADERVGLAPRERRFLAARFQDGLAPILRAELERLLDARGVRGLRLAETLEPVELVVRDTYGEAHVVGRLEPPTSRNRPLEATDFRIRKTA